MSWSRRGRRTSRSTGGPIVDCDLVASSEVHIPGAVSVQGGITTETPATRYVVMGPADFAATMEEMGIGDWTTLVVGYDNLGPATPPVSGGAFNSLTATRPRILDGGYPSAGSAKDGSLTMAPAPASRSATSRRKQMRRCSNGRMT